MMMYCDQCEEELATYWVISKGEDPVRVCQSCFDRATKIRLKKFEEQQRANLKAEKQ